MSARTAKWEVGFGCTHPLGFTLVRGGQATCPDCSQASPGRCVCGAIYRTMTCLNHAHLRGPVLEQGPASPATAPEGVRTSEGVHGAQGGAGGLGEAIRGMLPVWSEGAILALADRADALERERDDLRAALVEIQPAEVLVEGFYFPPADLPRVLGNFMRSSAQYAREAKAAQIRLGEVRDLLDAAANSGEGRWVAIDAVRAALATPEPVLNAGDEEAGQ